LEGTVDGVSFQEQRTLQEGQNTLTKTATDSLGNTSTASIIVTLDTIAPTITLTQPATPTNQDVILSYTASDNITPQAQITVTGNNSPYTQAGEYTVTLTATDQAGNSAQSNTVIFTIDREGPVIIITSPLNNTLLNTPIITLEGTVDGVSFQEQRTLQEGQNTVTKEAADSLGNTSSTSITVTLDTQAPTITLTQPTTPTNQNVTLSYATSDNISPPTAITVSGDNSPYTQAGEHTVTLTATDQAGNSAQSNRVIFTIDKTGPNIIITSPQDNTILNTPIITLEGTVDGTPFQEQRTLIEGQNTLTKTAADPLGNTSSASITVTLDTIAPIITLTQPTTPTNQNVTLSYTTSDNISPPALITVSGDNSPYTQEGDYSITLTATDQAGNIASSEPISFEVDKTPPLAVIVTDDGAYTSDPTQLHATWSTSSDAVSGIKEYQCAIGTSVGATDIRNWTSVGIDREMIYAGLSLLNGPTYYISVRVIDNANNISDTSSTNGIKYNASPVNVSIAPSSGSSAHGQEVLFTTTYQDADGYGNIDFCRLLINTSVSGVECFHGNYSRTTNKLYIYNDDATQWLGGYAPGSSNIIENSYCKVDCSKTTISRVDDTLAVTWAVTFKNTFTGAKNAYLYVKDIAGVGDDWTQKGTWEITNTAPRGASISPSSGSSQLNEEVLFTTTFKDNEGYETIQSAAFGIKNTDVTLCFHGYYNPTEGLLYLRSEDASSWIGGFAPGSANIIEHTIAKLDCSNTTVSGSGDSLIITWAATVKSASAGDKITWLYAWDGIDDTNGWDTVGTWTINDPPQNISVSPLDGTSLPNQEVLFTTTLKDLNGYDDIKEARFLVDTVRSPVNNFYGYYEKSTNKLFLLNDDNSQWLGGFAPGSPNVVENSYTKLNCANTTVTGFGDTLEVTWAAIFKDNFTGAKKTFMHVKDYAGASDDWTEMGTWTINTPPENISISPSSGSSAHGQEVIFTSVYRDQDGYEDIKQAFLKINNTSSSRNCFYGYYDKPTNKLYLLSDDSSTWYGGFAPGSPNIIENSYTKLDCSRITVSGSGDDLTITWSATFNDNFVGTKNLYLYVRDQLDRFAGWEARGTWVINNLPNITSISLSSPNNFHQGWPITIGATASDPDGNTIEYRYSKDSTTIQDWTTLSQITWNPLPSDFGERTIKVEVRDTYAIGNSKQQQIFIFQKPIISE
ncbi:hypothetical protein ACFL0T_05895, partial [Candidatus Omnitrophota bacterium]